MNKDLKPIAEAYKTVNEATEPTRNDIRELWNGGWKEYWEVEGEIRTKLSKFRSLSDVGNVTAEEMKQINEELKAFAKEMRKFAAKIP